MLINHVPTSRDKWIVIVIPRRLITVNWPIEMALKSLEDDRLTVSLPHTELRYARFYNCRILFQKKWERLCVLKRIPRIGRLLQAKFHELGFLRSGRRSACEKVNNFSFHVSASAATQFLFEVSFSFFWAWLEWTVRSRPTHAGERSTVTRMKTIRPRRK